MNYHVSLCCVVSYSGCGKCVLSGAETRWTMSWRYLKAKEIRCMQRRVPSRAKTVTLMAVSFQGVGVEFLLWL